MGFLSKAFRDQIMSPIGRPVSAMGVRPILREPGLDIRGERSLFGQPSPFGTPLPPQPPVPQPLSPLQNAFNNIQRQIKPVPIPPGQSVTTPQPFLQQPPIASPVNISGPALDTSLIPEREILQRPIIPPRRDDFMSIERINEPKNEFIPSMPNETPSPFIPPPPLQPVLQQPQPIGVPSLMDPRQPQPNLATGVIDPVSQPIQQLPLGPQIIPQVPNPFEKPIMPPKRDDFMSIERIGGPGGGFTDNRVLEQQPFVPPQQPTFTPISERTDIYGAGKDYDPANLPEGYSFNQQGPSRIRTAVMPQPGFVYAYGPDGDRISVPSEHQEQKN